MKRNHHKKLKSLLLLTLLTGITTLGAGCTGTYVYHAGPYPDGYYYSQGYYYHHYYHHYYY